MTPGRAFGEFLDELADRVGRLEADAEWQRRVGVMAACWPYALPAERPAALLIPAQRRPDPRETVTRSARTGRGVRPEPK